MEQRLIIMDTCDVIFRRLRDDKIIATTESQLASLSQTVNEEKIFGGIGSGTVALISSQKELELSVRDALWSMDYLEMTQGVTIDKAGKASVYKRETAPVKTGKATLADASYNGDVIVIDAAGGQTKATATAGVVTVTGSSDSEVTVFYQKEETGEMVVFDAEKFSEAFAIEYKTIAYNPADNSVYADVYIQFDSCKPSGAFDMSFEMGNAITPELNFSVLKPQGTSELGRILFVKRGQTP